MNPLSMLRIAWRALMRNKMRSFLTMLGVVIGVGAVIAMQAIGEGAKVRVQAAFDQMGTNLLIVHSGSSQRGGMHGGAGSLPSITWDDLKAIQNEVRTVRAAAPLLRSAVVVQSEDANWTTAVIGTSPEYFVVRNWPVELGRPLEQSDLEAGAKVTVLGWTVVEKLFGTSANPVGQSVRINNSPFEVVGVLSRKGQSAMGQDQDDTVLVPTTTFLAKIQGGLGKFIPGVIFVTATSQEDTGPAEQQISALLRDRHRLPPGAEDDFDVRNLSEIAEASQQGAAVLSLLLAAIAAVSLLVGGIGIMNIMLVSVTERTREIGVRMAVGARPRDVLTQFMTEALALSLSGGALGIGLGLLVAKLLALQFKWPTVIRPEIIILSVGFSALVGLGFGMYPARKASRLDPIDALRFE